MQVKLSKLLALSLLILFSALTVVAIHWQYFLQKPLPVPEQGVLFRLEPGRSFTSVAYELHQQNLLAYPRYFIWLAKLKGVATKTQAGEYLIASNTTPTQLLEQFTTGDVLQRSLQIIEGKTYRDLRQILVTQEGLQQRLPTMSEEQLLSSLGIATSIANQNPEGYFFPDTYYYRAGTSDYDILQRAYQRMQDILHTAWELRAKDLPLQSPYQALILASIIEKETAQPDERSLIAGVLINRLQKRMPLQVDPTVIYGLGDKFNGKISRRDLRHHTAYNTYRNYGLPPTPIALPSHASILAAVQPAKTDSMYFVAHHDGSGRHIFSKTLAEHNLAVQQLVAAPKSGAEAKP